MTHFLYRAVTIVIVAVTAVATPLAAQQFLEFVGGPPSVNPYLGKYSHNGNDDFFSIRDTLYVASYSFRPDSIFYLRSTDGGATWEQSHLNGAYSDIGPREWLCATGDETLLFVRGVSPSRMRVSTNGGWTWTNVAFAAVDYILNVTRGVGDTVFMTGRSALGGSWNLYRSVDAGVHWNIVTNPVAGRYVWSIAQNGGRVAALVSMPDTEGVYRLHPYVSDDGGDSWRGYASLDVDSLITDASVGSDIVIDSGATTFVRSLSRGVLRLRQGDSTWRSARVGLPPNTSFGCLAMRPDGRLYLGTNGPGVYYSDDQSQSWTQTDSGGLNALIHSIGVMRDAVYAIAYNRLFQLDDSVGAWRKCITAGGPPAHPEVIVADRDGLAYTADRYGNIARSTDAGTSWVDCTRPSASNVSIHQLVVDVQGRIYASVGASAQAPGSGFGIVRSSDRGVSWTTLNRGLGSTATGEMAMTDSGFFLGTQNGVYRSTNFGDTWEQTGPGIPSLQIQSVGYTRGGVVFAGTSYNGLWRSTDQGASWHDANAGLFHNQIWWISENLTGTLFVTAIMADSSGRRDLTVYRSTDIGVSWQRVDGLVNPTPHQDSSYAVVASRCNNSGAVFGLTRAATPGGLFHYSRLFRSFDDGVSWSTVDSMPLGSWWMAFSPDDRLFVLNDNGIYRSRNTTKLSVRTGRAGLSGTHVSLAGMHRRTTLSVHYTLSSTGSTRLALYDALGREVAVLVDGSRNAGDHILDFDSTTLPAGTYVLRLVANGSTISRSVSWVR